MCMPKQYNQFVAFKFNNSIISEYQYLSLVHLRSSNTLIMSKSWMVTCFQQVQIITALAASQ